MAWASDYFINHNEFENIYLINLKTYGNTEQIQAEINAISTLKSENIE